MSHHNPDPARNEARFFMNYLVEKLNDKTLPNKGDVLRHYLFLANCAKFQDQIGKKVVAKVLTIWSGLGIQTTSKKNCMKNLKKLWSDYCQMKKAYKEGLPVKRKSILDAWSEQCNILFFAEKRSARNDYKPEIKNLLTEASKKLHQFGAKETPYERLPLRPKTRAKGPEAGPSHLAAADANNNAPQSSSEAQTTAAPSPKRPLTDASNDLVSSEVKRRRAIAKLFEPAELAKSSTKRHEKKARHRDKKSASSQIHDGNGHSSSSKHRSKKVQPAKETGPAISSGDAVSQAEAMRRFAELMEEIAEDDKQEEALEKRLAEIERDADKKDVQVDVQSTEEAASMEKNNIKLTVEAQQAERSDFNQVGTSGGSADEKYDGKTTKDLEDGEIMKQQTAVEASPAKKFAEKQARGSEEIADAEMPESPADSTSRTGPARKKSRLNVPVEDDDGHSLDKEVAAGGSQFVAEVAHSNISNNGSNTSRPIVNLELASRAPPAHAPTAYDDPPVERNIAAQQQQPHQDIDIRDPQQEALLRAMHAHSSAPEAFRAQLLRARWPPKRAWSDHELLEVAISFGYEDVVVVLLQEGARVWRDGDGPRAFHRIIELGWTDVVELCLARGARVAEQDSAGNTALHVAFLSRKPEAMMRLLARRLVEETSVSVSNCVGLSTWHLLCGPGSDASLVELVLSRGYVDVNAQVPSTNPSARMPGYTALHVAAKYSQLETAKVLLHHGAKLHARNNTNSTPLHLACSLAWIPMVDLLLSHDDCLEDLVDDYGITHFMCACIGTRIERVKEFILAVELQPWMSMRELLESKTKSQGLLPGCTPLLLARRYGRWETVQLLLSHRPPDVQSDPINTAPLPVPARVLENL